MCIEKIVKVSEAHEPLLRAVSLYVPILSGSCCLVHAKRGNRPQLPCLRVGKLVDIIGKRVVLRIRLEDREELCHR